MPNIEHDENNRERQLDAIIAEYYRVSDAGGVADQNEFIERNPGFTAELKEFFSDAQLLQSKKHSDRTENLLGPTIGLGASRPAKPIAGAIIEYFGEYEILEELGTGGMGVVYKARHAKLKRIVALKMIRSGEFANSMDLQRFAAEAKAAAKLSHPGIVAVHEVGIHNGQHFYTMDYVEGGNLSQLHRDEPVPAIHAVKLVRQIAESMQYAHLKGIVHRDLKPANIMLTADGQPRITDFGLAKRVRDDDESLSPTMTESGQILGTAGFMSPEQAAGKTRLVGPSSDVYSLGAVLYALLTSRAPFVGETPSHTIMQVLQNEPLSPRKLNPSVPRDLETICLKCLEKEPHKRYGTALLLADDLELFLQGKPVKARPVSNVIKAWSWAKRNPWIAATLLLVVLSGWGGFYSAFEQSRLRVIADQNLAGSIEALKVSQWNVYKARLFPMLAAYSGKDFAQLEQLLEESEPRDNEPDFRGWEWHLFRNAVERRTIASINAAPYHYVKLDPLGHLAAARRIDGAIDIRDAKDLSLRKTLPGSGQRQFKWHPNRKWLATPDDTNHVKVWDVESKQLLHDFETLHDTSEMNDRGVTWNPDGTIIAFGGLRRVDLFDVKIGHLKTLECPYWANALAWSPNGKLLAVGGRFCVCVIDLESDKLIWKHYRNGVSVGDLQWNPLGTVLAAAWGSPDRCIRLYDLEGRALHSLIADHSVHSLAWSDEGRTLVSTGHDHQVHWWDTITGSHLRSMTISRDLIESMDTSDNADLGILVSADGTMRTFPLTDLPLYEQQASVPTGPSRIQRLQWHPKEPELLAVCSSQLVHVVDVKTGKIKRSFSELSHFSDFDWHPVNRSLVTLDMAGNIKHHNVDTGDTIEEWKASSFHSLVSIRWSPNGRQLLVGTGQRRIGEEEFCAEVIDTSDSDRRTYFGQFLKQSVANWSPDARQIAVHSTQGEATIQVWDVASQMLLHQSEPLTSFLESMDFNSLGSKIAMGGSNGTLVVVEAATARIIAKRHADSEGLGSVKWSPNDTRLMTCADNGTLRLWDSKTLDLLLTLDTDMGSVADWSPDGNRIATCTSDGMIRIWFSGPNH